MRYSDTQNYGLNQDELYQLLFPDNYFGDSPLHVSYGSLPRKRRSIPPRHSHQHGLPLSAGNHIQVDNDHWRVLHHIDLLHDVPVVRKVGQENPISWNHPLLSVLACPAVGCWILDCHWHHRHWRNRNSSYSGCCLLFPAPLFPGFLAD